MEVNPNLNSILILDRYKHKMIYLSHENLNDYLHDGRVAFLLELDGDLFLPITHRHLHSSI